jgi:hypothetical protein
MDGLETASSGADSIGATEMSADLDAMDLGGDESPASTETADTSEPDPVESLDADIDEALDTPDEEPAPEPEPEAEQPEAEAAEPEPAKDENGEELPEGVTVLKSYEKFPTELQGVKDLLRNEFHASLKKDPAWQQYLANQTRKAANAPTPAVRDAISADLETRSKAKAIYWADPQRNPRVKEILSQRAAAIKATSDARHQRHAVGAARRDPGAVGVPVKRTVQQTPNGRSTADNWAEAIDAL